MRILNITNHVPYPMTSGASLRSYNILRRLVRDHDVYLAAFRSTGEDADGLTHLRQLCREVVTARYRSLKEGMQFGKGLMALVNGEPLELRLAFSDELARGIQELAARIDFDIVQLEHGSMGMYLEALPPRLRKRAVWVLHDIDFDKFMQIARIEKRTGGKVRAWLHARMMRRWQPRFASAFGYCVTMSEADRALLLSADHSLRVDVSPNGVDTNQYRPLPEVDSADILFVGNMGYPPNIDAAVRFCRDVLPMIRGRVAAAKLWIVGIDPAASVRQLAGDGVVVTGGVPDVTPFYQRSRICVVPVRAGSGTRLKILEAMALGRPVVSTSIGCEGLGALDGEHLLIADDSPSFAEHAVKLLTHQELRARIAAKARQFVVASYDWDIITENMLNGFGKMAMEERTDECPVRF